MKWRRIVSILVGSAVLTASETRADGIDLYYVLTRVAPIGPWWSLLLLVPLVMLVNYGLNLLVVGWPVIRARQWPVRTVARPLVGFTIIGQLADRLGFILAGVCAGILSEGRGEGAWFIPMIVLSFVFTGVFVAGLAFYYVHRRWQVALARAAAIAAAAAILTNPAWVMVQLWRFQ